MGGVMGISVDSAKPYSVASLFNTEAMNTIAVYEIPRYQRQYKWRQKEWQALYDDLFENDENYYLGSIICINRQTDSGKHPILEVVDGQQRLTTISIFLAALYEQSKKLSKDLDEESRSFVYRLKQQLVTWGSSQKIRLNLQKTEHNNDDYKALLSLVGATDESYESAYAGNRRIFCAYKYFKDRLEKGMEEEGSEITHKISYLDRMRNKLWTAMFVKIEVKSHSEAYTLFESLNNRGMSLSAIDLLKNIYLARIDKINGEAAVDAAYEKWKSILNNLTDEYSVQERFFRHNFNAFRTQFHQKTKDSISKIATKSKLVEIYEKLIKHDPSWTVDELLKNSKIYSKLILSVDSNIPLCELEAYKDLSRTDATAAYMILLYLQRYKNELHLKSKDFVQITNTLISFFARRNMTNKPPTYDLDRMFMDYIVTIEENKYTGKQITEALNNKLRICSASDDEFAKALSGPIYRDNRDQTRFILCMLENSKSGTKETCDLWAKDSKNNMIWTIEHILPKGDKIPQCWVDMIANGDRELANKYKSEYVHTIGNLTITAYNANLGNLSFEDKKNRKDNKGKPIGYMNGLYLNSKISGLTSWSIKHIQERTNRLVKEVLKLFPL